MSRRPFRKTSSEALAFTTVVCALVLVIASIASDDFGIGFWFGALAAFVFLCLGIREHARKSDGDHGQ
jgi:FtsH-binding integral membrane protein